ncbi:MAG TPA: DHH family phosphoesterase [Spirochaetia bacterium]|nr:DHH family phosphoesterase [Spirochaetia bacterium]
MNTKLDELVALLSGAPDEIFIQPHNVPDPDAIASSCGLQYLLGQRGVEAEIVYESEMEKANSLKMLDIFEIKMSLAGSVATMGGEDWTVLVDAQKGNANITDLVTDEVAAIDHHEYMGNKGYRFEDIRPEVGACSTIIAQYFKENRIEPPSRIATALTYGIFMDTDNLTRGVCNLDIDMFYFLYNHISISHINELKGNQISKEDLTDYAKAFEGVEVYGELGFLRLDSCNDSLLGTASDIVTTIAGVNVVVAYSIRDTGVKFSTRSITERVRANELVRYILDGVGFGGGHESMAGGFLPFGKLDPEKGLDTFVRFRAIAFVDGIP